MEKKDFKSPLWKKLEVASRGWATDCGWSVNPQKLYDFISQELDRARGEVEKKFREKCKKREEEMNVPYSEEDGKEFWQGYQEGYRQGLHDMIIDTFYLDKEFQSKLTTK